MRNGVALQRAISYVVAATSQDWTTEVPVLGPLYMQGNSWEVAGFTDVDKYPHIYVHHANGKTTTIEWQEIVFDHGFAKALWGEREVHHFTLVDLDNGGKSQEVTKPIWHYHLQQMVVAADPLEYLGDYIRESKH